ncbi:MAG: GntR family transcriptional regulator [Bacteroidetes bacterium]|nr:GntR family transcriptional regulator [Bacteroidota bacterium]
MPDFRTEAQKLVDALREAIISGDYKPGDRLPQRKIGERFNTTTIVAREALRILENEKLVIIEPRFGAMVEEVTPEKLKGRYIVREALEGMAARLACENMTVKASISLKEIAKHCDNELNKNELSASEKARLHQSLHDTILDLVDCDELIQILKTNYLNSVILSNAYHIDWSHDEANWHSLLIDAIISGDPNRAEKMMRKHVTRGLSMELEALGNMKI